jgi:NAD(P)H-nitrite reductase large subunit
MDEDLVCYCLGYTQADLKRAIAQGHKTLQDLQANLRACTRCHGCKGDILELLATTKP